MHRIVEMALVYNARNFVVDVIVGQDGAQKLLLGFNVMRYRFLLAGRCIRRFHLSDFAHCCPSSFGSHPNSEHHTSGTKTSP